MRSSILEPDELLPEALIAGLQWLLDNGYIEVGGPLQADYVLTAKGFAELSSV